jgi:hypothetical protein
MGAGLKVGARQVSDFLPRPKCRRTWALDLELELLRARRPGVRETFKSFSSTGLSAVRVVSHRIYVHFRQFHLGKAANC